MFFTHVTHLFLFFPKNSSKKVINGRKVDVPWLQWLPLINDKQSIIREEQLMPRWVLVVIWSLVWLSILFLSKNFQNTTSTSICSLLAREHFWVLCWQCAPTCSRLGNAKGGCCAYNHCWGRCRESRDATVASALVIGIQWVWGRRPW